MACSSIFNWLNRGCKRRTTTKTNVACRASARRWIRNLSKMLREGENLILSDGNSGSDNFLSSDNSNTPYKPPMPTLLPDPHHFSWAGSYRNTKSAPVILNTMEFEVQVEVIAPV